MSATTAFKNAARRQIRSLDVLVRIDARDPGTLLEIPFYFSNKAFFTPGSSLDPTRIRWSPKLIDAGSISSPGAFGDTGLKLCDTTVVLTADAIDPSLNLIDGARVNIWLWESSLSSFDDALCVLKNAVVLSWSTNATELRLEIRQRADWNRPVTIKPVSKDDYPRAPESSVGQMIPVVYGDNSDVGFRTPWPRFPNATNLGAGTTVPAMLFYGPRRANPGVVIDTGRGGGTGANPKAKVLFASHKCKTLSSPTAGCGVYLKSSSESIATLDINSSDVFNGSTGAGCAIPDYSALAWVPIFASDVELVTPTQADNPRGVLDKFNEANYAKFDYGAGQRWIRLKTPSLDSKIGTMAEVYFFIAYRSSAALTNFKFRVRHRVTGNNVDASIPASTNHNFVISKLITASSQPSTPWAFLGANDGPWATNNWDIEIGWPQSFPTISGSGSAEVFSAGFLVKFIPAQTVFELPYEVSVTTRTPRTETYYPGQMPRTIWDVHTVKSTIPAVEELTANIYANLQGYADDGEFATAGAFTGSANALIEKAPDILAHLLVRYGGESLTKIETGVGEFGSFTDARSALVNFVKTPMRYAFSIDKTADIMAILAWVTQASVSNVFLDRFTDKWRLIPWDATRPVDYDWKFRPEDLCDPNGIEITRTPSNQVMTGLSLAYSYDGIKKNFQHKTRIAFDGSQAGFAYKNIRDQVIEVKAGVSDRIPFKWYSIVGSAITTWGVLTPGAYTPALFGKHVSQALDAARAAANFSSVSYGSHVVAGYNDIFTYSIGFGSGTVNQVTIPPGEYSSFDELCAAITSTVGVTGFSLSFNRTSMKATATTTGGTVVTLHFDPSQPIAARRLFATLGWIGSTIQTINGASYPAYYSRAEETFAVVTFTNVIDLLWDSGPYGNADTTVRHCAATLGFAGTRDFAGDATAYASGIGNILAESPKGTREALMLQAAQRYGIRKEVVDELRIVNDTDTAREIRNRLTALFSKPRLEIVFSSNAAFDLERGRVIEFSEEFDRLVKYPDPTGTWEGFDQFVKYPDPDSDGSWAGKRFMVIETNQNLGPVAFFTKIRAVALD